MMVDGEPVFLCTECYEWYILKQTAEKCCEGKI